MTKYLILSIATSMENNKTYGGGVVYKHFYGCPSKCPGTDVFDVNIYDEKFIAKEYGYKNKSAALRRLQQEIDNAEYMSENRETFWKYDFILYPVEI